MGGEVAAANSFPLAAISSGPRREHAIAIQKGSLELEECFPLPQCTLFPLQHKQPATYIIIKHTIILSEKIAYLIFLYVESINSFFIFCFVIKELFECKYSKAKQTKIEASKILS